MKKISSILLALTMLLALCVPAFAAPTNVQAMTHEGGKQIASAIVRFMNDTYVTYDENYNPSVDIKQAEEDLTNNAESRQQMYATYVMPAITAANFQVEEYRTTALREVVKALKADYNFNDTLLQTLQSELDTYIVENYAGLDKFDKDEIKDNVADNFADKDLDGLFNTMKNTINDLGGRVSDVFRNLGGKGNGGAAQPGEQPDAGMKEPTGDTGVYAVMGVALAAGAALVLTRKKSSK